MKDQDSKLLWEAYDSHDNPHHKREVKKLKHENPQLPLMRAKAKQSMGIPLTDDDKKALKAHGFNEGTDGSTDDLTEREKFKLANDAAKDGKGPLAKPKAEEEVKNEDNHDEVDEFGSAHYVLYKYDPASKDIKPLKKYKDMSSSEVDQLSHMLADLTAEQDGLPRDETFPFVEDERVHDYFEHYMPDGMDVAQVIAIDEDYNLVKLVPDPGYPV